MGQRLIVAGILLAAMLPAVTLFWQFPDIPQFGSLQDDAVYLETGKALATGKGYVLSHLPGAPWQVKYPPLYPALIAAAWKLNPEFPSNLELIAGLNLAALAALVAGLYSLWLKHGFEPVQAAGVAMLTACLPSCIYMSMSVMTEIPCLALLVWALVFLEGEAVVAAGVLASLACLTRSAATPLLLTAPLLLGRRRWRFLAAALPLPAAWHLWTRWHSTPAYEWSSRFYLDYGAMERMTVGFDNVAYVVYGNVDSILTSIGEYFIFGLGHSNVIGLQIARLIGVASICGAIRLVRQSGRSHYGAFAAALFGMLLFWHYPPEQRLAIPLAPLCAAGLVTELAHLSHLILKTMRAGKAGDRVVASGFAGILALFCIFSVYSLVDARVHELTRTASNAREEAARLRSAFSRIAETTPESATILSDQDVLLSIYAGRAAYRTVVPPRLFYPMQLDRARQEFARLPDAAVPWTYLYVSRYDWRHTLDEERREELRGEIGRRSDLDLVWRDDTGTLYARKSGFISRR